MTILEKYNLINEDNFKEITLFSNEIKVLQYLPVEKKKALIEISVQDSIEKEGVNTLLLDVYIHLYIMMFYTDMEFSEEDKLNPLLTYDILEKNGVINTIISAIPKNEYADLIEQCNLEAKRVEEYNHSFAGSIVGLVEMMPKVLEKVQTDLEGLDLDSETIKNVIAIAKDNGAV